MHMPFLLSFGEYIHRFVCVTYLLTFEIASSGFVARKRRSSFEPTAGSCVSSHFRKLQNPVAVANLRIQM
jgi:hypothetical protein